MHPVFSINNHCTCTLEAQKVLYSSFPILIYQLLIDLIGQVLGISCPALYPTFVYIPSDKIPGSLIETHFTSVARPSTLQLFKRLNPYLPDPAYIHFVHALLELVLLCRRSTRLAIVLPFLATKKEKKKKKKNLTHGQI